jgi:hypothetical protein
LWVLPAAWLCLQIGFHQAARPQTSAPLCPFQQQRIMPWAFPMVCSPLRRAVDPDCHRQRRLQRITAHHTLLARVAGGLGVLPLGLRRGLIRMFAHDLDPHAVDTVAQGENLLVWIPLLATL